VSDTVVFTSKVRIASRRSAVLAAVSAAARLNAEGVDRNFRVPFALGLAAISSLVFGGEDFGCESPHLHAGKRPLADRRQATAVSGLHTLNGARVLVATPNKPDLGHVSHVTGAQRFGRDSRYVEFGNERPESALRPSVTQPVKTNFHAKETMLPRGAATAVMATSPWSARGPLFNAAGIAQLDRARDEIVRQQATHKKVIASAAAVTVTLSGAYLIWLLRAGILLSSLLSSVPAWYTLDPLPVLARARRKPRESAAAVSDPVEGIFNRSNACRRESIHSGVAQQ
jgi:hypothetical protein